MMSKKQSLRLKYAKKYALKYYKQYLEKLAEEQLELVKYLEQQNKEYEAKLEFKKA